MKQFIYASALNRVTEVGLSNAALNGIPAASKAWLNTPQRGRASALT